MFFCFFFFKQKTAYEMRISDWSSDVCSSDLALDGFLGGLVVVVLDLLVVLGLPVDEHADGNEHVVGFLHRDGALGQTVGNRAEIGRASCRESVWQYV